MHDIKRLNNLSEKNISKTHYRNPFSFLPKNIQNLPNHKKSASHLLSHAYIQLVRAMKETLHETLIGIKGY